MHFGRRCDAPPTGDVPKIAPMTELLVLATTLTLYLACAGFVRLCDRI